jgi:hypothetical protein
VRLSPTQHARYAFRSLEYRLAANGVALCRPDECIALHPPGFTIFIDSASSGY